MGLPALSSESDSDNLSETENDISSSFFKKPDISFSKIENNNSLSFIGDSKTTKVVNEIFRSDPPLFISMNRYRQKKEVELQWWLGRVTEVKNESFKATLEDLNGRANFVEFDNVFISEKDKDLLTVGAKFTYVITVSDSYSGQREYKTKIAFDYRRRWKKEYQENVEQAIESIFPDDLLDL